MDFDWIKQSTQSLLVVVLLFDDTFLRAAALESNKAKFILHFPPFHVCLIAHTKIEVPVIVKKNNNEHVVLVEYILQE